MRKSDYATLALILRGELQTADTEIKNTANNTTGRDYTHSHGRRAATLRIARNFAASASVKRAEFLKACGIEP